MACKKFQIIVLGGGLTGLSTAKLLNRPAVVLEKNISPGGLCRSYTNDGFTFDYTGHLLHFKENWTKALVSEILDGNIVKIERNAAIYSNGRYTPYPFQANTWGLPADVVKDCLLGFINSILEKKDEFGKEENYKDWVENTFGYGIVQHFLEPYNNKLFRCNLTNLSNEWVDEYIPKPDFEMVLDGALGIKTHRLGYNAHFYYPQKGGIQGLVDGLTRSIENIMTGVEVISIDIEKKIVKTLDGNSFSYEYLVSTIPLNKLMQIINPLPENFKKLSRKLEYVSVLDFNLGIARKNISPYHWIYFPENKFVFYRCGFPSNFSDNLAPEGTSSIYVEISMKREELLNEKKIFNKIIDGLVESKILKSYSEVIHSSFKLIDVAYVIYNHERRKIVSEISNFLLKKGLTSIGRYGAWEYSAMEEAIIWGKNTAERINQLTA